MTIDAAPPVSSTVVAFYGVRLSSELTRRLIVTAEKWMVDCGCPPTDILIHKSGHPGKAVQFLRGTASLKKTGFADVTGITLFAVERENAIPLLDYQIMAEWSAEGSYVLVASREPIAPLPSERLLAISEQFARICDPAYGIGYVRDQKLGPVPYAIGIAQGLGFSGPEYDKALRISRWGDTAMRHHVYREGLLRDVYRWNFLASSHLARLVEGNSLRFWIGAARNRGTLRPLSSGLCLWEVSDADVDAVRRILRENALIFGSSDAGVA